MPPREMIPWQVCEGPTDVGEESEEAAEECVVDLEGMEAAAAAAAAAARTEVGVSGRGAGSVQSGSAGAVSGNNGTKSAASWAAAAAPAPAGQGNRAAAAAAAVSAPQPLPSPPPAAPLPPPPRAPQPLAGALAVLQTAQPSDLGAAWPASGLLSAPPDTAGEGGGAGLKKIGVYLVRSDGFTCTREVVSGGDFRHAHPATEQARTRACLLERAGRSGASGDAPLHWAD